MKNMYVFKKQIDNMLSFKNDCYTHLKKKRDTFTSAEKIIKNVEALEATTKLLTKELSNCINTIDNKIDNTLSESNTLDEAVSNHTKSIINKLNLKRISDEMELSYKINVLCANTLLPIFNNGDVGLNCPICLERNEDIYAITTCGHIFCKECINRIKECSLCRKPFNDKEKIKLCCDGSDFTRSTDTLEAQDQAPEPMSLSSSMFSSSHAEFNTRQVHIEGEDLSSY